MLVVKKLSMVVTPSMVLAGTAVQSSQAERKEEVTKIIPAGGKSGGKDTKSTWYEDSGHVEELVPGEV